MSIPQLNHQMTLESPMHQSDGAGGYTETWTPVGQMWAELIGRSGRATVLGNAPVSTGSYKITVRGAPQGDPRRPMAEQRFRAGLRIFAIQAVVERDAQSRYLTCFVDEEVAT
ncbi:head-tail adaptor protein [Pseudosulfitobacter sp. SM2401]|jgi:SPP1 family predicted phage head-tail adaptor|uniref:head-tail adaptor protein n=1 Tax=Pseudosulfitobacter sp. SM2401 TaxID=3350098 RepID=UPI0036F1FA39